MTDTVVEPQAAPSNPTWVPIGPTSVAGALPAYSFQAWSGATVAMAAGTWTTVPIPAPGVSQPPGAFTINTNGGIVVRDAGLYSLKAVFSCAASPAVTGYIECMFASSYNNWTGQYGGSQSSSVPNAAGLTSNLNLAHDLQLPAGAVIYLNGALGSAGNGYCFRFDISGISQQTQAQGIPQPVVQGQWLKGSGNAAIWAPIAASDLPSPIPQSQLVNNLQSPALSSDLNLATASGWYRCDQGGANSPDNTQYWHIFVMNMYGNQIRQMAYQIGTERMATRRMDSGTWQPWILSDGAWQTISLLSGWTNYGGSWGTPRYRKLPTGIVMTEGLVSNGSPAGNLFQLPAGYRPSQELIMNQFCNAGTTRLDIGADGSCSFQNQSTAGATPGSWTSIVMSWFADQ
jgi:hypothetical protein